MILLDTHVWVRWIAPATRPLPESTLRVIDSADELAVAAVSCWEVINLHKRGRIALAVPAPRWLEMALAPSGVTCLPMTCAIAEAAGSLADVHRDPADRIILATAIITGARLLTLDASMRAYPEIAQLLA